MAVATMTQSCTQDIIYEVVDYIDANYNENINLSELSSRFYISTYYLSRTFKKVVGCTFNEYLNEVRILAAKDYLESSNYSVSRISELCGYESLTHFGRMFKRLTESSPRQYKMTMLVNN